MRAIDPQIKDRVAVVTGANNPYGIGAAVAEGLAACGARVVISYLRAAHTGDSEVTKPGLDFYEQQNTLTAAPVVERIRATGGTAASIELDLGTADGPGQLLDFAEHEFGPVEILVNNAAHCVPDTLDPKRDVDATNPAGHTSPVFDAAVFDRHIAVNSRAVGLLTSEFARRHVMRDAAWGRIVNVSTDAADCFATEVSYGASKAAIESLSRSAAVELAQYGITVNIVAPGPIQTGYIAEENAAEVIDMIPLGRLGQPDDVADVIVFLASEQARWLTGQLLYVGGGKRM